MRKISTFLSTISLVLFLVACEKDEVAKTTPPEPRSLTEQFDSVGNLGAKGWVFRNNTKPGGFAQWTQAMGFFPAYSANYSGLDYAACYYDAGSSLLGVPYNISTWMITPSLEVRDGDKVSFYTRRPAVARFPDRMQFRANLTDDNPDVGNDSSSVGNFKTVLFDINPNLATSGADAYPTTWTRYEWTVTGIGVNVKRKVRFAFRYYVKDGGSFGTNSYYIGVDQFELNAID